jgi:hypothetical protein
MKGEQPLVTYVFSVLLTVTLVVAIILLLVAFYGNLSEREINRQLSQINSHAANEITKLYATGKSSTASPGNFTSIQIATASLSLPAQVSGKSYEVSLVGRNSISTVVDSVTIGGVNVSITTGSSGSKIVSRTREDPTVEVETALPNIDADIQGKIVNGINSTLTYVRYNVNGTVGDIIVAGPLQTVVKISSVEVS